MYKLNICKICDQSLIEDRFKDMICGSEALFHYKIRYTMKSVLDEYIRAGNFELYKSNFHHKAFILRYLDSNHVEKILQEIDLVDLTPEVAKHYYQKLLTYSIVS